MNSAEHRILPTLPASPGLDDPPNLSVNERTDAKKHLGDPRKETAQASLRKYSFRIRQ